MMSDEDLAEIAYNAYGDSCEWKIPKLFNINATPTGPVIPAWNDTLPKVRMIWAGIARAVREEVLLDTVGILPRIEPPTRAKLTHGR